MAKWSTLYFQLFTSKCKAGGNPTNGLASHSGPEGGGGVEIHVHPMLQCWPDADTVFQPENFT